jgi:eukaryotic-like serine/threonine-protein kinase
MRTDDPRDADRTTVERRDPLVGTVLDQRFRIDRQLAAGGFGAIYRATDVRSDAEVALKVLHPQMARDQAVVARFRREGATLSNLRDPHTITAYELGEAADGTLYIVMELLHGESLYEQYRATGRLSWRRVVHIARGVCSSLAEAHAAGVVHRDLKPANIHLERRGDDLDFVKVLDFGIAKIVQGGEHDRRELTQAGHMIGTVDYMSPEQMVGGEMTPRSDIYTLGIVMYEMIAGHTPFPEAQSATAILAAVLTRTPEPLSRHANVPPALEQIVARCLAREPQSRFGDISELDDALAQVAAAGMRPSQAPRVSPLDYPTQAFVRHKPGMVIEGSIGGSIGAPNDLPIDALVEPTTDPLAQPLGPEVPSPVRATPVEFVGGLPARATPPPPALPVVPTSGFEQVILTTEATRIDVRFTDSSEPVLDARGPRARVPEVMPPKDAFARPAGTPNAIGSQVLPSGHARGSQNVIEARSWQPPAQGRHAAPGAMPSPVPGAIAAMPPSAMPPSAMPPSAMPPSAMPPSRASTHEVRSYDMAAAANYDALVRRIIWLSLIAAIVIAILIATH